MSRYYRRTSPGARETLTAALVSTGVAVGVASVTFYLVRIFLAREPLEPLPKENQDAEEGEDPVSSQPSSASRGA